MGPFARIRRLAFLPSVGLPLLFLSFPGNASTAGTSQEFPDLVVVEAPVVRPEPLSQRFPQGSRLVRLAGPGQAAKNLTPDFFAAADPRTSFDGQLVLFSGKKSADAPWQIWEMDATGSPARQITHGPGDCLRPAYLPRGEIVYTVLKGGPEGGHSQVWVSKGDGRDAHPITFGPGEFQAETVLENGTILVTASSPLLPTSGKPADRQLYTLRPDGTGLATLRCDHEHPAIRSQAEELPDGSVVFVKNPIGGTSLGGELAWIRRGALHNAPLTSAGIAALSPEALASGSLVVSRAVGATASASTLLGLYSFDPERRKFGALIYRDPQLPTVAAVPVAAHEPPRWYWSTLNPQLPVGYFICLDGYVAQGVPQGRLAGSLTHVRVWMLEPETQREMDLGQAPIEPDGSFYIAVPPDQPVRFELLDGAGQVVRAQRSWIWSRPGEERGCVGCHEDRARAPENRWPLALRRLEGPTTLPAAPGHGLATAARAGGGAVPEARH